MAAIIPTDRSYMQKLELEYAQAAFTTIQKIVETLRKKLMELATLEARRLELEIALLQQTIAQTAEFERVVERVVALEAKCKEMRNPNVYSYSNEILGQKWLNSYYNDLYRNFAFCIYHSHKIDEKGAENAYHKDYSHTTWDALTLPAGRGRFPRQINEII